MSTESSSRDSGDGPDAHLPIAVARLGLDLRIRAANDPLCALAQRSRAELCALHSWRALLHPDEHGAGAGDLAPLVSGAAAHIEATLHWLLPDGSSRWVEVKAGLERDDDGAPSGYVLVAHDVSAMVELREQGRVIGAQRLMGIALLQDDRIAYANDVAAEVLGATLPELLAMRFSEIERLIHPDDRAFVREQVDKKVAGEPGAVPRYRFRLVDNRGGERFVEVDSRSVMHGGRPADLVAFLDVTASVESAQALEERSLHYRRLLETASDGVHVLDADGKLREYNPAFCRLLGYSADEIAALHVWDWDVRWDRTTARACIAELVRAPARFEAQFLRKDGSSCDVELATSPLGVAGDTWLYCAARDVSAQKRAAAELRTHERHLALVIDGTGAATWDLDVATGASTRNGRLEALLGYERGRLDPSQQAWAQLIHPDDRPAVDEAIAAHLRGDSSCLVVEYRMRAASGAWHWVRSLGSVVERDDAGQPRRMTGIVTDIDAEHRARERERVAERERRLYAGLAQNLPDALIVVDRETRVTVWAGSAARVYGYEATEAIGQPVEALLQTMYEPGAREILMQRLRAGERARIAVRQRHKSGAELEIDGHLDVLRDATGEPSGYLAVLRDVSAERQLQRRLVETQRMESVGLLAAGVAHDFNNLLAAVVGNVSLALEDVSPQSPLRESLEATAEAARRATDLTRQLLAYAGKGRYALEPVDLHELVAGMARLLASAVPKSIALVLPSECEPGATSRRETLVARGDRAWLQQAIVSVVTNAAEAIGAGAGTITVSLGTRALSRGDLEALELGDEAEPGRFVALSVKDSGPGFGADTRAQLFLPFFSTKFLGRGLGLAAVRGIVRSHRGAIAVASAPGEGACITLYLPESAPAATVGATPAARTRSSHARVLVVDDEPLVRNTMRRVLERAGLSVVEAGDGVEALALLGPDPRAVQLVILDVTMPRMGGAETARQIRVLAPALPIVVTSGYAEGETRERFAGSDIAAFVGKPFDLPRLLAVVEGALAPAGGAGSQSDS